MPNHDSDVAIAHAGPSSAMHALIQWTRGHTLPTTPPRPSPSAQFPLLIALSSSSWFFSPSSNIKSQDTSCCGGTYKPPASFKNLLRGKHTTTIIQALLSQLVCASCLRVRSRRSPAKYQQPPAQQSRISANDIIKRDCIVRLLESACFISISTHKKLRLSLSNSR